MSTKSFERLNPEPNSDIMHLKVAGGLALISVGSFFAQRAGITQEVASPLKEIVESGAHPVLGYIGAWSASKIIATKNQLSPEKTSGPNDLPSLMAGATVVNFFTEYVQSRVIGSPETHFLAIQNFPETTKDYAFAIAGALWFAINERRTSS